VALVAATAAGMSGCKRPPPTPPAVAPWSIQVVSARGPGGGGETGLVRCNAEGQDCTPLSAKDPVPVGSIFRVARGGAASLSLGAVVASFAPETEVALTDGAQRVVSLRKGAFVISFDPTRDEAGGLPTLRFPGGSVSLPSPRATSLSLSVQSIGAALVTVHHGLARMIAGNGPPFEVKTGQTVRVSPEGAVDRRAGFRGELALAEVTQPDRDADVPRGLGSMTARVPGTDRVVGGVRLASHAVRAFIRDGFARTEVEEVFQNDTDQVLEGRYVFPLPPDASISRLGLWVGERLMEGEMVESKRAAAIFKSIVDDTVRPRDPALLEWIKGSEFSLKVFPLPVRGTRQVLLAYNQMLPMAGGRVRYVYPLSLGKERATRIDDLSIQVKVSNTTRPPRDPVTPTYAPVLETSGADLSVTYQAQKVAPDADFVLAYREDTPDEGPVPAAAYVPGLGEFSGEGVPRAPDTHPSDGRYVALRLRADLPADAPLPASSLHDRAIIVDVSQSQSKETVRAAADLVKAILDDMDADESFVLLACDSACTSFPAAGLTKAAGQWFVDAGQPAGRPRAPVDVVQWLQKLSPGGSSDVAGALLEAAQRLSSGKDRQIIYVGDGAPSSGELKVETMVARLAPVLGALGIDLRLLGAGRTVDEVTLTGLAQGLGGVYERVATGEPLDQRGAALSVSLRSPVLVSPRLEVPAGLRDVFPETLPNVRLGQEIIVLGKASGADPLAIRLTGTLAAQPYALARTFTLPVAAAGQNPLVPRLWAEQRIRALEASATKPAQNEVLDLSHRFHVMSRYTSLLVLENEKMFAEFGIARTTHTASDQSDEGFMPPAGPAAGGRSAPAPAAPRAPGPMYDFEGGGGNRPPPGPSAAISRMNDAWMTLGQRELDKLANDQARSPSSRRKLEALVRGLIGRGRFAEALPAARRFVDLDPDLPLAFELLSFAAVVAGDGPLALSTVDGMCEAGPESVRAHLRAAKAFEGAGSEARACGHWRSLAELDPKNEDHRYESLRCRARTLGQTAPVLEELRAAAKTGKRLAHLQKALEAGTLPPAYSPDAGGPGALEVTVTCEGDPSECPAPVVISPLGTVFSPWTPGDARTSTRGVAFSRVTSGMYRVLLVGGAASAHGQVAIRALDEKLSVPFTKGGTQSVASAQLSNVGEMPAPPAWWLRKDR
jgi:hypothetical protein